MSGVSLQFSPLVPLWCLLVLIAAAAVIAAAGGYKKERAMFWRAGLAAFLAALLMNPVLLREARTPSGDKVIVVLDDSASMTLGGRDAAAQAALARVQAEVERLGDTEAVIVRAGGDSRESGETKIFTALQDEMQRIPLPQVAGTVIITDGQVHDVPGELSDLKKIAPVHALLVGEKDAFDNKVTIVSAPKYGVLGQEVSVSVRVDSVGMADNKPSFTLNVLQDGEVVSVARMQAGVPRDFRFTLRHPGQNVFAFSVPAEEGELTAANNTAAAIVNGVRDRLRVLLVSDAPHMGERAWRNLLKSDPSVDLVHFTILRSPAAVDPAQPHELSLIAFPVDELFQQKLKDFDLVIFDRYQQYALLSSVYFKNIADYVRNGGAFLMALGTDTADRVLATTEIGKILPAQVTGVQPLLRQDYVPRRTQAGNSHAVTADLPQDKTKPWGTWHAMVDVAVSGGDILLEGASGKPLLVVGAAGEGRVAVLASDNIWLWSKSGRTAGPYSALLRNLAHWLMKEPELDDGFLKVEVAGDRLTVSLRDRSAAAVPVRMTAPSGAVSDITLPAENAQGWKKADVTATETGIHVFESGTRKVFAVVGDAASAEFGDVHTTQDRLRPVAEATGGSILWASDAPSFSLRRIGAVARVSGGSDWLGIRPAGAYTVDRVEAAALLPVPAGLGLLLAAVLFVWWRESGRRRKA